MVDHLTDAQLVELTACRCPDCRTAKAMVGGPRGAAAQNVACRSCGAEFNEVRHDGVVIMAHRNSVVGAPDRERLRSVFGIELPG
jgi:hypothetical protein